MLKLTAVVVLNVSFHIISILKEYSWFLQFIAVIDCVCGILSVSTKNYCYIVPDIFIRIN